ncbi:hypothetical protein, partial [Lysinibacillus mangiferihumi]|uniref:hypothetical protein n=1 Tax=Lysinibacillus mangiferihumi TaxID=1130819 RepID=UPI001B87D664
AYCAERKAPPKRTTTAQQKSVRLMAVNLTLFLFCPSPFADSPLFGLLPLYEKFIKFLYRIFT